MGPRPGHRVSPSARSRGGGSHRAPVRVGRDSCAVVTAAVADLELVCPPSHLPDRPSGSSPRPEPRCSPACAWPVEQRAAVRAAPFVNVTQFLFYFLSEVSWEAEGLGDEDNYDARRPARTAMSQAFGREQPCSATRWSNVHLPLK